MIFDESTQYVEQAFAKINLHLEVLDKMPDGYHNILTIMVNVGLCDLLKLESFNENSAGDVSVSLKDISGAYANVIKSLDLSDNLIARAVAAYCRRANAGCSVEISVQKNIPLGAGLGGGSADAAAMLRILDERMGILTTKEVLEVAAELGADVPFCYIGGAALCEGIGDIIEKLEIPELLSRYVVIINDATEVNTASAYKSLCRGSDELKDYDSKKQKIVSGFYSGSKNYSRVFFNDFEEVVYKEYPHLKQIKEELLELNAEYAVMTGSGSSLIGLFRNNNDAEKAVLHFKSQYSGSFLTEFKIY